jgi:integrase/recombinase XerC
MVFYMQMRLSEAIQQFIGWKSFNVRKNTTKGYDLILRQFAVFMRDQRLEAVKIGDVMEWFDLMQGLGWDQNSFVPRAMALRKFFEFYNHQGYKVINPWLIPVPQKQYKLPRVADEKNYRKLLAAIPEETNDPRHIRNRAIVMLLWDTGARNGEILSIDTGDIDLRRMKALIRTEKSKGMRPIREIFWTRETNDALEKWIRKRRELAEWLYVHDEEALFISVCNQKSGKRLSIKGVGEMLRRYSNRAGIPYMNAHSFRHHMGHHIVKRGGSNSDVSNILGHSSLQSSFVYTQMTNIELQERYRSFMSDVDRKKEPAKMAV